uniref:Protein N-lysine methyltransferase METTL21A n=1 Tax=Auxenochlorella protothecoides TaxID=3075 RepID=A0A1D2AE27_AUXPR
MATSEADPDTALGDTSACSLDVAADLAEAGDFQGAIPMLRAATHNPHPAKAWEMLSQCLTAVDDHIAALDAATSAVAADPGWHVTLRTLGRCRLNLGDLEGAAAALSAACRGAGPSGDEESRADLEHVGRLLQRRVGHAIGIPGLVLANTAGEGPSGLVWDAGRVLAAWLVQAYAPWVERAGAAGAGCGPGGCRLDEILHCCRREKQGTLRPGCGVSCDASLCGDPSASGHTHRCRVSERSDPADSDHAPKTVVPNCTPTSPRNAANLLQHVTLLELGSGTGVVGLSAACLGARVTLTDLPEAAAALRANAAANRALVERGGGSVAVRPLAWQEAEGSAVAAEGYDLVLGADLVYNDAGLGALEAALRALFCGGPRERRPSAFLYAHKARHPGLDVGLVRMLDGVGLWHEVLARQPQDKVTIYLCTECAVVDDASLEGATRLGCLLFQRSKRTVSPLRAS